MYYGGAASVVAVHVDMPPETTKPTKPSGLCFTTANSAQLRTDRQKRGSRQGSDGEV
jgi:hypothetical protein